MVKEKGKEKERGDVIPDEEYGEEDVRGEERYRKIREKLKVCNREKQEYLDGWQRSRADFINLKKECEARVASGAKLTKAEIMEDLLPVIDSFEMAMGNKEAWERVDKNWRTGIEHIYNQLISILEKQGLKELNPLGERFDINFHTATEEIKGASEKENETVAEVVQKGYMLEDRLIRPAKVKVAKWETE